LRPRNSVSVPQPSQSNPLQYSQAGRVGQAFRFVAAAGCRNATHWTLVPGNYHCSQAQAIFPHGRVRSTVAPVSVAEQDVQIVGPHPTSRLIGISSLGLTSFPTSTILGLAHTLHRRPSARHTGDGWLWSASIRNSGSPPFNVVPSRLPWPLSAPWSRTLWLGPLLNPMLCPQYEAQFPSSEKFSVSYRVTVHVAVLRLCCCSLTATFDSLPHLFQGILHRREGALRLHPAEAAPF
jgi:hypothetical protein